MYVLVIRILLKNWQLVSQLGQEPSFMICWFLLVIYQAFHSIPVWSESFTSLIRKIQALVYSTLLSLSLNNSKRNSFELLLLNIFIFALSLDSYAILCVDNKDMPLFVYYIAMLLGVVCYHTHITQLCFSLCLLHTSLPLHVCVITFASFQRIWTM